MTRKAQKVRLPYNYFRVPPQQPVNKANVTLRSTIGKRYAPTKYVTKSVQSGNRTIITTKSSRVTPSGLVQKASSQRILGKVAIAFPNFGGIDFMPHETGVNRIERDRPTQSNVAFRGLAGARGQRPVREIVYGSVGRLTSVRTEPKRSNVRMDTPKIKAKKGYHGYVNKPTYFLAGEAGKERVDITPINKKGMFNFDFTGGMKF